MSSAEKKKHDRDMRALRIYFAWKQDWSGKEHKFIKDISYKSALTEGQRKWRDSLVRKHRAFINEIPEKALKGVTYNQYGALYYVGGYEDPEVMAWANKYWENPYMERGRSLGLRNPRKTPLRGKTPAPSEESTPSAGPERHVFERDQAQKMIAVLDTLISKGAGGMFKGFKADLERGKGLTEKQLKATRHQLYRRGMRPDASLFKP